MFSETTDLTLDSRFIDNRLPEIFNTMSNISGRSKLFGDRISSLNSDDPDFEESYRSAFGEFKPGGMAIYGKFFSENCCDCCGRELNILNKSSEYYSLCTRCDNWNTIELSSTHELFQESSQEYLVL